MKQLGGYSVGQLSKLAHVSTRTIRYYTAEGLLPAPATRGRYAIYNDDHLQRLRLIKHLKDLYLPLAAIRDRLVRLSPADVRQALLDDSLLEPPTNSAAAYIAQVLEQSQVQPLPLRQVYELPSGYQVAGDPPVAQVPDQPPHPIASPMPAPAVGMGATGTTALQYGYAEGLAGPATPKPSDAAGEIWQRLVLAPGVELQIRVSLDPANQHLVGQLLGFAKELFDRAE